MNKAKRRSANNRNGSILIAVLVCLGLIATLMFSAVRISLQQRRQLERELQMEQTLWLADAGLAHAAKLIESGEAGEDVTLRPKLVGKKISEVKIEFVKSESKIEAKVTAWIGLEDRPELQTRQQQETEVKKTSGE